MNVITPLPKSTLESFFDETSKEVIKYFIIKSIFSQPEILPGQKPIPVQIPKEHIEQWFTQALNVKPVGAGSYPIDIYNEGGGWGADIKMLSVKTHEDGTILNGDSGEASLGQNFRDAGIDLDSLFATGMYEEIKDLWLNLYKNKFESVKLTYPVDKFYYFFILRSGSSFYLVGADIDTDKLKDVKVDYPRSSGGKSVYITGMIADDLGNTKVYKAKKRLELRLNAKNWINHGYAMKFSTNFESIVADLRTEVLIEEFLEKNLERFKNLKIDIS